MSIEYILEVCGIELPKENILLVVLYWREEGIFYEQLQKILQFIDKKYSI